ncbi:MAG: anti-sigma B factor antagonist [Rubritalea sp.]|jgi:anti-sigma B factor antagonist|tara:strand:+ start:146 stop:721 length:576 start_codon:yes stop_codon:yes gene_type:complete
MFLETLNEYQLRKAVSNQNQILVGKFDGFSWIRCVGKGSFSNSPQMKQWAETHVATGRSCVVVDLELCTGMDSTFMGTMAGIAMRLAKLPNGALQVTGANEKNRNSLEDLGLSMLLEIEPKETDWRNNITSIRNSLQESSVTSAVDRAQHVFDAHKILCEADETNDEKFSTVLDVLEAELENRIQRGQKNS